MLGTLGTAISNGDQQAITSQLGEIERRLNAAANLESELNDAQGERNEARKKLDHLQGDLEVKYKLEDELNDLRI